MAGRELPDRNETAGACFANFALFCAAVAVKGLDGS
jgi:hypothetical protein